MDNEKLELQLIQIERVKKELEHLAKAMSKRMEIGVLTILCNAFNKC